MTDYIQYGIGKPDTGEERTWEEVAQTLPPHVLAAMGLSPPAEIPPSNTA